MNKEHYRHLTGTDGYQTFKLPPDVLLEIKPLIDKIQNNFSNSPLANHTLAGQIDHEYKLSLGNKAVNFIKESSNHFLDNSELYVKSLIKQFGEKPSPLNLSWEGKCWVNFQKKYEYNPIHSHSGVISFVIWYQIPFNYEDERVMGAGKDALHNKSTTNNGQFNFVFHNGSQVVTQGFNMDKTWNGYMAMFPSSLGHMVYPFYTSDNYRITISGNISLQ